MTSPASPEQSLIPHRLTKEQRSEILQKLDLLSREDFLKFFHEHVQHYGPNWIVRNPGNVVEAWRVKPNDGLPYVRRPDDDNNEEMIHAHYLWTKEFLSVDNFQVFLKLLQTDFSRDEFINQLNEADYNFIVYWATLIVKFAKDYPRVIPEDLVHASSICLGFVHHANQANHNEKFPYGSGLAYTYKYRQRLAIREEGTSYLNNFQILADMTGGQDYVQTIDLIKSRLPGDLEIHREAGLHYGVRAAPSKRDARVSTFQKPETMSVDHASQMAYALATQKLNEKGNAYYRTERGQQQSYVRQFADLSDQVRKMTEDRNPQLRFTIRTYDQLEAVQESLFDEPGLGVGTPLLTRLNLMEAAVSKLVKKVAVETWDQDRKKLVAMLEIMREASARSNEEIQNNAYAGEEYVAEPVKVSEAQYQEILNKLKAYVDTDIVKEKKFSFKPMRETLLGKLGRGDLVRIPNYPIFGAVTLATVIALAGFLESQGPGFTWANDLKAAVGRVIEQFSTNATAVLENWSQGGSENSTSEQPPESSYSQAANNYLQENMFYEPINDSLEALKSQEQPAVFTVETAEGTPWAIPTRLMSYSFDTERPFQVTWQAEPLKPITSHALAIETRPDQSSEPADVRFEVNISNLPSDGVAIPISFDGYDKLDVNLYAQDPADFTVDLGSMQWNYLPTFIIGESGAMFLYLPHLPSAVNRAEPLQLSVELRFYKGNPAAFNMDAGPLPGIMFTASDSGRYLLNPIDMKQQLFTETESREDAPESAELRAFLIDQGFDLDRITQVITDIKMPEGASLLIDQEKYAADSARAEMAMYQEIIRQMNELGFTYSNDTRLNTYLSADDIRTYFVIGQEIGLDCDGLSFVANVVANASQGVWRIARSEIILAEADVNNDGAFAGGVNHAQIRLRNGLGFFPGFETTAGIPTSDEATPAELAAAIEKINNLVSTLDQKAANFNQLVNMFTVLLTGLSAILVARSLKERAQKRLKLTGSPKEISRLIQERAHRLEARTTERLFPAFAELTPTQLAKVTEVLTFILNPDIIDRFVDGNGYSGDEIKKLLTSFELMPGITPKEQLEAAGKMSFLTQKIFEARSNSAYRKALLASLDSVIDTQTAQEGMEPVLVAIRALLI